MHPMLNIALRAVRKAGNLIVNKYEISKTVEHEKLQISYDAEKIIIDIIYKSYPKHSIITKNSDMFIERKQDTQWIINSLNGKTNFIKNLPHFAISIAVCIKGRIEVAVIYDPMRNELFTAIRGQGSQLNGYRLRANNIKSLSGSILAIEFTNKLKQYTSVYINIITKLFIQHVNFRSTGSTVLDLAYVAAGRIDGYFTIGMKPLNLNVAELIVRESGNLIIDFNGNNYSSLHSNNIIIGNPRIVQVILSNIGCELNKVLKKI